MATGGGNLMGDEDMWDDKELIRAYDKAVKNWRRSQDFSKDPASADPPTAPPGPWVEVTKPSSEDENCVNVPDQNNIDEAGMLEVGSWILGAPCRALYSEDGLEYEAKIVGMEGPRCTVRFVGYGNEEETNLSDLKTTHGKKSRDQQRRAASKFQSGVGVVDMEDLRDCVSNISLTSSMYNNYTDSICRDRERDLDDTLTGTRAGPPIQASTPRTLFHNIRPPYNFPPQNKVAVGKLKFEKLASQPVDNLMDSAIPSAAEATIDSSSEVSLRDEPREAPTNLTNGDWENFNNTMPPFRFPVPPMPLSLSKPDGSLDFGRGEFPSLLMSWYMAGYQAGFFDAKQEQQAAASPNRSRESAAERMGAGASSRRINKSAKRMN